MEKVKKSWGHNRKPVVQMDLNGNEIRRFPSILDAWKYTGIDKSGIAQCCNKLQLTAGKHKWKYATDLHTL